MGYSGGSKHDGDIVDVYLGYRDRRFSGGKVAYSGPFVNESARSIEG